MEMHPRLSTMKTLYASFMMDFKGSYEDAASLKKLTDFRYEIVELFDSESPSEN